MVGVLSPGLSENGHASPSHDDNVASLARTLLASSIASNQEDKMMSREERHAMMKEISQHQAIKDELNKKRGGWRTPRRGWFITDSPVASSHASPTPNALPYPAPPKEASNAPSSSSISPVPEQGEFAAQEIRHIPHPPQARRPPLPPPRRSYSVIDYEPPLRTHRTSAYIDIFDLPIELYYTIFDYLDPIDSACLGLTNTHFYDIHRRMHGIIPLSSHRNGPNNLEWAFHLASRRIPQSDSSTSIPTTNNGQEHAHRLEGIQLKGQVYCRKCGYYRCQLYRHLRTWMGPEREYCEITKKYGRRAPEGAADQCSIKSPRHPHRCARHSAKPPSVECQPAKWPPRFGIENLRLEILDGTSNRVSIFDKFRLEVERQVGHRLDWSPFPVVNRRPVSAQARLIWKYGGQEVSIFLDRHQFERYRHRIHVSAPGILPTAHAPQSSSSASITASTVSKSYWQRFSLKVSKALQSWQKNRVIKNNTAAPHPTSRMIAGMGKESYFCIDKYWTSFKQTSMYTVPYIDQLEDDYQLFLALGDSIKAARGSWMHRWSSWRTCTGVQLSKFTFLFDDCDLVKAFEKDSKGKLQEICKGYEYSCLPELDPDEHMQLMAEIILHGLQEPERGKKSRAVLDGIPKLQAPPGIHKRQFNSGWGFYTTQGYSLMKILLSFGAILTPGVVFVVAWLCLVSAIDLQNAFVPITFLAGVSGIILAALLMCSA